MRPRSDAGAAPSRSRWSHPLLAALGVAVAMVSGVVSVVYTYTSNEAARDADARLGRQTLVANVLKMEEYFRSGTAGSQGYNNALRLLAADSDALLTEFGQDRLHVSASTYRVAAEYIAFAPTDRDSSDLDIAERMALAAIDASPADGLEALRGQRIMGSIAARRGDPEGTRQHFDTAVLMSEEYLEEVPNQGVRVDLITRAHRLLGAYLGVSGSADTELRDQFCAMAAEWAGDLEAVSRMHGIWHVELQLDRLDVERAADLAALCP